MDDEIRLEWERLEAAADRAWQAYEAHHATGFRLGSREDAFSGPDTRLSESDRAWWARNDELKQAAESARDAADHFWERNRPR